MAVAPRSARPASLGVDPLFPAPPFQSAACRRFPHLVVLFPALGNHLGRSGAGKHRDPRLDRVVALIFHLNVGVWQAWQGHPYKDDAEATKLLTGKKTMGLSCEPCINGKKLFGGAQGTNLNLDNNQAILLSVAGGVLWLTTLLLSAILGATKSLYEGQFQGYYFVVFAFTLITAFSALFDYNLNRKTAARA